jgi:hypothetical protein
MQPTAANATATFGRVCPAFARLFGIGNIAGAGDSLSAACSTKCGSTGRREPQDEFASWRVVDESPHSRHD